MYTLYTTSPSISIKFAILGNSQGWYTALDAKSLMRTIQILQADHGWPRSNTNVDTLVATFETIEQLQATHPEFFI